MATNYPKRKLGDDLVSAIGLGCMGMSTGYASFGGFNDDESFKVLTKAADMGITFWDTSDFYGPFTNELLIGRWFKETGRRDEIFLATKFAAKTVDGKLEIRGDPEYVKEACRASLERLGIDHIDLYYQHRVDSKTPIEHTIQAMAELKKEGKIRYLGISECSARSLRRAYKIHPITAVQMEYSPFALQIESKDTDILRTARELGVKVVAYSPLGRGFLTGAIQKREDLDEKDTRSVKTLLGRAHPRFSEAYFQDNLKLAELIGSIAKEKGCTPGQLSLAWVLAQGEDIIPIPGTKRIKYLEENAQAVDIKLSQQEEAKIRDVINGFGGSKGDRYPTAALSTLFGDSPELE
ncbi:aldo-keto reductase [Biscogniauxia marginata]|nr:aldo-keto reductase [Biscogniauxia marginata]